MTRSPSPEHLVHRFVAEFSGNPIEALRAIEDAYGLAIHYQDRGSIETALGRGLSDDEWGRVREYLPSYHDWLLNSGAGDSIAYWRDTILDEAGITADDEWDVEDGDHSPFDPRFHTQPHRIGGRAVETVDLSGEAL